MRPKNILLLCDAFDPPAFTPRVRCMCDYLCSQGCKVTVCTEHTPQMPTELPFAHDYEIKQFVYYKSTLRLEWLHKAIADVLFNRKNRKFAQFVCQQIGTERYDYVFCSTFNSFPLTAAQMVSSELQVPLHVDLRDVAEQCPGGEYNAHKLPIFNNLLNSIFRRVNIKRRNDVVRLAQSVTSVSPWHVQLLSQLNDHVSLVYNGYDKTLFTPSDEPTSQFVITYTGRIYGARLQDPTLFFEAMQQLASEHKIDASHVRVHWYVKATTKQYIQQLAHNYVLEHYFDYFDYVSPQTIPDILHKSSVALVFANKVTDDGPHGIMTTKFFEALGVEKPVLCVRSDESCLSDVIRQTNAGLAATNVEEVKQFILEKYAEWQQKGFTHQLVNQVEKTKYSRQMEAEQFAAILEEVTKA